MLVDMHVHLPSGAGREAAAPRAARAAELGLDGIALVGDGVLAPVSGSMAGVCVFVGAEIAADRGHYLVFFPRPAEIPPLEAVFGPGVPAARDVIARTHALRGAVVAAHPYARDVERPGGDIVFTLRGLAAIEAVNARLGGTSRPAVEAADVLGLACTGGSDAREPGEIGGAATLFPGRFADEAGLVAALHEGLCRPVEFGEPPWDLLRAVESAPARAHPEGSGRQGPPRAPSGGSRRRGPRRR